MLAAISIDSISPQPIPAVDARDEPDHPSRDMKKASDQDELRPHYDFDYTKMKPNRFAGEKKVYKKSALSTKVSRRSSRDPKA